MKMLLLTGFVTPFLVASLGANAAETQSKQDVSGRAAPLGTNVSSCGKGNPPLWMTRNFRRPRDRDIYLTIAESLDAIDSTPDKHIDSVVIEDKLRSRIGDKQVTCRLTLRPSGRVEGIKILESSGNPESDKKAIALLKGIASYGIDRDSHENLSYQVELPKLRLSPLKP